MKTETVLGHLAGRFSLQTENLATEALAFILQRSTAARSAVETLASEAGCPSPESLSFQTQLSNQDGSRPDLVGRSPSGNVRLLIEAKFWAGLTGAQPVSYLKGIAADGGLLLFVVPEQRSEILFSELVRRIAGAGLTSEAMINPDSCQCVRVGSSILGLISWRALLQRIAARAGSSGDAACIEDVNQLAGLCNRMDADAFLPLTSEEITSTMGRRVVQFCSLANDITDKLVHQRKGNVKGLRATGGFGCFTRYVRLKGYGSIIQFSAVNWSNWGESPLWFGIKGEDWKPSAKVREALNLASIKFREEYSYCFMPLYLPIGAEKAEVIQSAIDQILKVLTALPEPASALISELPDGSMANETAEVTVK